MQFLRNSVGDFARHRHVCARPHTGTPLESDPDPAAKAGERLFTQSCQFCHGVRQTGAAFGWDFVEPTPVAEYRQGRNFFLHVRYKPQDAIARGLRMPALSYMSEDDARSLWRWLKAVADTPLRPYRP